MEKSKVKKVKNIFSPQIQTFEPFGCSVDPSRSNMSSKQIIQSKSEIRNNKTVKTYTISDKGYELLMMRKNKSKELLANPYLKEFAEFMLEDFLKEEKNKI